MTKFNKGAKVTSAGGAKCIVLSQARNNGAVLIETAPGVKPYRSTYVPAESLTKGHGRVTATPPVDPTEDPGQYGVPFFKKGDPDHNVVMTVVVDIEEPTTALGITMTALEQLRNDEQAAVDVDDFGTLAPERVDPTA